MNRILKYIKSINYADLIVITIVTFMVFFVLILIYSVIISLNTLTDAEKYITNNCDEVHTSIKVESGNALKKMIYYNCNGNDVLWEDNISYEDFKKEVDIKE